MDQYMFLYIIFIIEKQWIWFWIMIKKNTSKKVFYFSQLSRSEFMRQFLLYGHVLSTEEAELYADYELKKNPPTLDNFKEQVCFTIDLTII